MHSCGSIEIDWALFDAFTKQKTEDTHKKDTPQWKRKQQICWQTTARNLRIRLREWDARNTLHVRPKFLLVGTEMAWRQSYREAKSAVGCKISSKQIGVTKPIPDAFFVGEIIFWLISDNDHKKITKSKRKSANMDSPNRVKICRPQKRGGNGEKGEGGLVAGKKHNRRYSPGKSRFF